MRLGRATRALVGSSSQAVIKLGIALIVVKVLASGTGPEGLAHFGQFQTLIAVVVALTTAPWTSAIVRLVAGGRDDPAQQAALARTLYKWVGTGAVLLAVLLVVFADSISAHVLGRDDGAVAVRLLAVVTLLSSAGGVAVAFSIGAGEVGRVVRLQIVSHVLNGAGCLLGFTLGGMAGAVLGLTAALGVTGLASLLVPGGEPRRWLRMGLQAGAGLSADRHRLLSAMALVAVLSSLTGPFADYLLRQQIAVSVSWDAAGYWQALNKLSEAYLFAITAMFGLHYLPALGAARSVADTRRVMAGTAATLMPAVLLSAAAIYVLRDFVVGFALSAQFRPVTAMVSVQLAADVLRVVSMLFGHVLLARSSPVLYAVTECGFSLLYLLIGLILIPQLGWPGAVYAYLAAHMVYLVYTLPLVMRILREPPAGQPD